MVVVTVVELVLGRRKWEEEKILGEGSPSTDHMCGCCRVCVGVREGRRRAKGGPGFEGSKKGSVKVRASEWLRV
jgi:hypothetical protein